MKSSEIRYELKRESQSWPGEYGTNKPGFEPANVREKLPEESSGIFTPSSISSMISESTGIG